jgi:septum site-determining protein MinC
MKICVKKVLSDGDIHVYGILSGRALAGINGDEESKIYVKDMRAELVSIGSLYSAGDNFPESVEASSKPCVVSIVDNRISFSLVAPY